MLILLNISTHCSLRSQSPLEGNSKDMSSWMLKAAKHESFFNIYYYSCKYSLKKNNQKVPVVFFGSCIFTFSKFQDTSIRITWWFLWRAAAVASNRFLTDVGERRAIPNMAKSVCCLHSLETKESIGIRGTTNTGSLKTKTILMSIAEVLVCFLKSYECRKLKISFYESPWHEYMWK